MSSRALRRAQKAKEIEETVEIEELEAFQSKPKNKNIFEQVKIFV